MTYKNGKVEVGIRDIGEIIKLFESLTGKLNAFNVISRGITLNVSQRFFTLELGFEVRQNRPFKRVVKIPIHDALNAQLTSLPSLRVIDDSIKFDEKDGIILSIAKIPEGTETILLNIRCPLKHPRFLDRLVHRKVQIEPRKNITSYWMSAQFKHLDTLRRKLQSLRVDDLDFLVRIHMQQDIKNIIPRQFIRQLEVGKELLRTRDRNLKMRLASDHLRLSRTNRLVGMEEEVIKEIEDLLKPNNFETYLDVVGSFIYHDCFQAASFFRIPNFVLPSAMTVITQTDLSLEEPASKGELKYDRGKFEDELENIFPRKMRRK